MDSGINAQNGNNPAVRTCFKEAIKHLPVKATKCLDLGSGISFVFEKELFSAKRNVMA